MSGDYLGNFSNSHRLGTWITSELRISNLGAQLSCPPCKGLYFFSNGVFN